jgi:hypothetical protein
MITVDKFLHHYLCVCENSVIFSSTLHVYVYVNCINLKRVSVMQNVFWEE